MASRNRSNPLALAVLACLFERPMHPYEVATTLRARAKDESIRLNYGSLYSVVSALEKRRMITPVETEREGRRPERTVYRITDAGRAELVDWLSELLGTPEKEYPGFEAGLSLMPVLPPDDVVRLLENRTMRLRLELEAMRATHDLAAREGLPRLFTIEGSTGGPCWTRSCGSVMNLRRRNRQGHLRGHRTSGAATSPPTMSADPADADPTNHPSPPKSPARRPRTRREDPDARLARRPAHAPEACRRSAAPAPVALGARSTPSASRAPVPQPRTGGTRPSRASGRPLPHQVHSVRSCPEPTRSTAPGLAAAQPPGPRLRPWKSEDLPGGASRRCAGRQLRRSPAHRVGLLEPQRGRQVHPAPVLRPCAVSTSPCRRRLGSCSARDGPRPAPSSSPRCATSDAPPWRSRRRPPTA